MLSIYNFSLETLKVQKLVLYVKGQSRFRSLHYPANIETPIPAIPKTPTTETEAIPVIGSLGNPEVSTKLKITSNKTSTSSKSKISVKTPSPKMSIRNCSPRDFVGVAAVVVVVVADELLELELEPEEEAAADGAPHPVEVRVESPVFSSRQKGWFD